jgi:hypothetical protein
MCSSTTTDTVAVRYKNWKMYYTMTSTDPTGDDGEDLGWTMVDIKRSFLRSGGLTT